MNMQTVIVNNPAVAVFELLRSLEAAVTAASGTPPSLEALGNMTALDLLALLAPNGVRFTFNSKGAKS